MQPAGSSVRSSREGPSSRKPWLFMDLDGVISPVPSQTRKQQIRKNGPPRGFRTWSGAIYDMYVDARLLDWAAQLDRAFDVVWSTGWGETLLPVVATPLGLDHWPILSIPPASEDSHPDTSGPLGLKAQAIADHLTQDPRPFAWCDDFLTRDFPSAVDAPDAWAPVSLYTSWLANRPYARAHREVARVRKPADTTAVSHARIQLALGSTRSGATLRSRRPSSVPEAVGGIALSGRTDQSPRRPIETSKGAVGGRLAGTVPVPLAGTQQVSRITDRGVSSSPVRQRIRSCLAASSRPFLGAQPARASSPPLRSRERSLRHRRVGCARPFGNALRARSATRSAVSGGLNASPS